MYFTAIAPTVSGGIFACAWWIFIDMLVVHHEPLQNVHFAPGLVATFGLFLMLSVPMHEFRTDLSFASSNKACARMCVFFAFVVSLSAIGASFFLTSDVEHLKLADDRWLAGALLAQTVLVLTAGLVCICHRLHVEDAADF